MKQLESSDENQYIYTELLRIADNEQDRLVKNIPQDNPAGCFVIMMEITRMYDYLHFGSKDEIIKFGLSFQEIDVLKSGWNLASSFLFKSIKHFAGIPIMESTHQLRITAISLLYQFGCVILLRRTAEMLKSVF
jgi:hypothetical protein